MIKLVDEELPPGCHAVEWGSQGATLRSGVYFARFHAGGREFTQRFVVLR
jgi:hypothetical protein